MRSRLKKRSEYFRILVKMFMKLNKSCYVFSIASK